VLSPEPPIADWLLNLETSIRGSAGFFLGRPAVLDLASVKLSNSAIAHLVAQLEALGIRIMGIEGAADELGTGLPPALKGGRATAVHAVESASSKPAATQEPASLLIDTPVRSGQSIFFPNGDVTVLGSVASGAEIVAGGSIHIYGTLRGRAMAGAAGGGNKQARIFCGKIEAELLAIDGYYRTTDDLEPGLCARPAQAWLDGETLMISALG
jgi:septum site-determining protein MinC